MPSVKESVTEQLGSIGPNVREKVVTLLVDAEVEKRTNAVVSVVKKLDDAVLALRKVSKPDVETFNADGTVASATFSKPRLDEMKKTQETIAKLEKALDEAFDKSDFQKVFDLSK
jgi:hypothetical protein